jgi:hypothetical protein
VPFLEKCAIMSVVTILRKKMRKFILLTFFLVLCFNLFADEVNPSEKTNVLKPSDTRFVLGAGFTWANNPELWGGH